MHFFAYLPIQLVAMKTKRLDMKPKFYDACFTMGEKSEFIFIGIASHIHQ